MTEDEQEALSCKYCMGRIMRLSSGNIALLVDGQPLKIIEFDSIITLLDAIPSYESIVAYNESLRPPTRGKITSLNLADLGL